MPALVGYNSVAASVFSYAEKIYCALVYLKMGRKMVTHIQFTDAWC